MSCSDSTLPSTESSIMGAAMNKASNPEEMSPEIPKSVSSKEDKTTPISDAPASPSIEEQVAPDSDFETYSYDDDSEYDDAVAKEQLGSCSCESCLKDRKMVERAMRENRKLQIHWIDLRTYIRMVYRMALEVKPPTELYHDIIKKHVQRLCGNYPHQLFLRLETEVQDFLNGILMTLVELVKDEKNAPFLPSLFITGLLEGYKKVVAAADEVAPLLECLEKGHLSQFNLTWRVFNQHLYQCLVYADPFVLDKVPECIVKLSNKSPDPNDEHKKLVREFLSFDDEITLAGSMWRESEAKILQYSKEQLALNKSIMKQRMDEESELIKAHRIARLKYEKGRKSKRNSNDHSSHTTDPQMCSCEECALSHLLTYGGIVTPPLSPTPTSSDMSGLVAEEVEVTTECECHVCTAPPNPSPMVDFSCATGNPDTQGSGFHLYPHIHGTGGAPVSENVANVYPHLYNIHSSLQATGKCSKPADNQVPPKVKGAESKGGSVLRPSSPPVPPPKKPEPPLPAKANSVHPAPPNKGAVKPHRHSTTQTPAPRLHQNLPDVVPPVCHSHSHNHHGHSHNHAHGHTHHSDLIHGNKRVPCGVIPKSMMCQGHDDDETSPEDSCSDRSSSTQRGDSRHCDCCYCEVFGHGVPSVAPVSRNYTEMRERLRLLLNKKKAKCKTAPATTTPTVNPAPNPGSAPAPSNTAAAVNAAPAGGEPKKPKDPRDLEDLLDFIEGNPSVKCKDEKKAAKKARQKQKKQEEIERKRKEEEEAERRRIEEEEAARALLKQQRKEAKKLKKKKKAMAAMAAKGEEQTPQMVTIKRIMEPNSAEPTVTITLRGQTPNEDKVLYTLLNGQVCSLPGKDSRSAGKGKQQPPQAAAQQQVSQSGKGKSKTTQNNASAKTVNSVQGQASKVNNKTKKETTNNQKTAPNVTVTSNTKKKVEVSGRSTPAPAPAPAPAPPPPAAPQPQAAPKLTSPAAIQINNAINRLSSRQPLPNNFSIDSLKLPPGITITKVDPSQVTQRRPIAQPIKPNPPPSMPAPPPQMQTSSNVIVVDTGRLKDLTTVPNDDFVENTNGKKKKKKKPVNGNATVGSIPANEPPKNNMVRLTMNGGPPRRMMNPAQPQNGRVMPPQAAIIKVNGSMVTIRSPALQQALSAQEDPSKKKKKKKGGQGQHDESWNPIDEESVFAPKDIDLESGEMDDAERELEAFKRFCLQSVPPQRKEKVHLNIKDIVLKKKSSAISCS